MKIIESIDVAMDVTLISLHDMPADLNAVADVFTRISAVGVDVDMISQCPLGGTHSGLSFTVQDAQFGEILPIVSALRTENKELGVSVSSGNCKISVFGQGMKGQPGIAASVLSAAAAAGCDLRMITTSETDISLLVVKADADRALKAIESAFFA